MLRICSGIFILNLREPQGRPEKDTAESLTLCAALGNAQVSLGVMLNLFQHLTCQLIIDSEINSG
jgi:hypothetical protein